MRLQHILFALTWIATSGFSPATNTAHTQQSLAASSKVDVNTLAPNMKQLSIPVVEAAIQKAVGENGAAKELKDTKGLVMKHVSDWSSVINEVEGIDAENYKKMRTPWHFGVSLHDAATDKFVGLVTFHIAYSSWDGRILHLDYLESDQINDDTEPLVLRTLAAVALDLDCSRLTWIHTATPNWHMNGSNKPEMHGEVLNLSMDQDALRSFLSDNSIELAKEVEGPFSAELVEKACANCLEIMNKNSSPEFRLRLAQKGDLATISRLVQGLADYVKEPDSVNLTPNDYVQDGFALDEPLWRCILLDKVGESGEVHTCGFAFVFLGYKLGLGRFMHLEDLFMEVEHRGGGGGNLVIQTLAQISVALQCSRLNWQALDWNTPALNFYKKIGAKIHEGEKTSRYALDALRDFEAKGTA